MDYGKEIRKIRIKAGLSQEQLAELCGEYRQTINNIENGQRVASDKKVLTILQPMGYELVKKIVKIK